MNRNGFTLIELITTVLVIGVLANIAIPLNREARSRALAASAVNDINVIRTAVIGYIGGGDSVPASAPLGTVSPDLVSSLPNNFSFVADGDVRYQWVALQPAWQRQLGWIGVVVIQGTDPVLMKYMKSLFGNRALGSGNVLAVIIQ